MKKSGVINIRQGYENEPVSSINKKFLLFFLFFMGILIFSSFASASLIDGLKIYWNFDSTTGTEVNNMNENNSIAAANISSGVTRDANGIIGTSFYYNGSALVNANTNYSNQLTDLNSSSGTISLWFNWSGQAAGANLISLIALATSPNTEANSLRIAFDNRSSAYKNITVIASSSQYIWQSTTILNNLELGKFHHLVVAHNGTGLKMYLNGTEITGNYFSGSEYSWWFNKTINNGVRTIYLSPQLGTEFKGAIDEIGIWNRSLSSTEVSTLYEQGILGERPYKDIQVSLNSPSDNSAILNTIFNATITPRNLNLTNATIYIWYNNGSVVLFNKTTNTISGLSAISTTWNISSLTLPNNFKWNVLGCGTNDTGGVSCEFADSNYTFDYGYKINSETYDSTIGDLSISTFILNLTLASGVSSSTATLYYNGIAYSSTKSSSNSDTLFTNEITIPAVYSSQSKNFYWAIYLTDSEKTFTANTTQRAQTVTPSLFTSCNTTWPVEAVNFSVWDETDKRIINNSAFDISIIWKLSNTSTYTKNVSYGLKSEYSYRFCINPNSTFITDSVIKLTATGYASRIYQFSSKHYSNISVMEKLYMLNSSDSTTVILEVQDLEYAPLPDYTVKIYRYDPTTNTYFLVQQDITDEYGQVISKLVQNDVEYKFAFYDENMEFMKETSKMKIACRSSICVLPFTVEVEEDYFERMNNITDYEYSLSFNNNTNIFTFTWNDNTGETDVTHRLQVVRTLYNGTESICNSTSTSLVGSLTCNVGSQKASYSAQAFRTIDNNENRIAIVNAKVGDISDTFGLEGMIISFILLFTLITIGLFSPSIGMALYLIGFLIIWVTGFVYIDWEIFVAQMVIGVLFIWAFRG